ncbi:hypothetical protein [Acholeplasma granularum]|uniref:hypothetical protein n=1 Tax=Acholeplasma granularum TaxID=264635 RepID=UPI000472DE40|nr:hypothetical protein [Acholeplasma granularum]
MIKKAFELQKTKKYIIQGSIFLTLFLVIYFLIDYLNMSYVEMSQTFGTYLVVINIVLNIVMALLSTLMMNLSTAMVEIKGRESKASSFGFLSILFGILTYGCTGCVIAFFSSIGIAFSVIALPLAGFPYKIISLALILIGLFFILREIKVGVCKIKPLKD